MDFISPLAFRMNTDRSVLYSLAVDVSFLEDVVRLELDQPMLAHKLHELSEQIEAIRRSGIAESRVTEGPYESHIDYAGKSNTPWHREEILLGAIYVEERAARLVRKIGLEHFDMNGLISLYETSRAFGAALRHNWRKELHGLYFILDVDSQRRHPILNVAEAALKGGARLLQLRAKSADKSDLLTLSLRLRDLCERHDALFIVNDHPDIARVSNAHGYHGGQQDLPVKAARDILKPAQFLGRSNALLSEALDSQMEGADYIAIGDIFGSPSKQNTRPAGLGTLRKTRDRVDTPLAAIGGINETNVVEVVQAGADIICVISAIMSSDQPEVAARRLVDQIEIARSQFEN